MMLVLQLVLTRYTLLRYFGAYIIFVAFLFGSAFAQNYATLIVTRFVCDLSLCSISTSH